MPVRQVSGGGQGPQLETQSKEELHQMREAEQTEEERDEPGRTRCPGG